MKRKIFSLSLALLLGLFTWNVTASTGWYQDYIKLNINEAGVTAPTGWKWIGTDPSYGSSLVAGLGNVTSLKLDGADMKYWSDTQDRTGSSFFYEVKSADGLTTYTPATELIMTHSALGGNDFQGTYSGANIDLLAGVPAGATGTACKLTVWAKSWGTGQGDSWLTNGGANYVATFTKTNVLITGATGISNTGYATLKSAFDAINANAAGVNTDEVAIKVYDNTTETATAVLNPSKGVSTFSNTAGSGYVAPVVTLTGGTTSAAGSLSMIITNGAVTSITMTGGTWTAAPTVTIAAPAGGGTTATATASGTSGNQTFTITNGGSGYGPKATFSGGGGTGAAIDVKMTTAATALSGTGPRTATFAGTTLAYTLTCPGSGYTSNPTCAISSVAGGTGGTVTVTALYPSIEFSKLAIYPTVASKSISGAVGLISIVGRKNITIDGRVNRQGTPSVGNSANLTISSTHATNPAIAFNSNAQNDTVQYCTLKGQEVTSPLGIVNFGTGTSLSNGNGLNVIDHNLFAPASGTVPSYAIYAQGNMAFPNVGNRITNNEFKDLMAQYVASTTLYVTGGLTSPTNDNYTISGNSFYNSVNMADFASSNLAKVIIGIGVSTTGTFGGSHTISGNYIGGTAASCGGSVFSKTARETTFTAMSLFPSPSVSGGGATSIQGNTIQKISWSNDYYTANWFGMNIGGTGDVNIGTVTSNTIGDNTTNGSITVSNTGTASVSATIFNLTTTGTVNFQNNKIGSINVSETTANYVTNLSVITRTGAGATTISNNIIGSTTQANSINATSSGTATQTSNIINCSATGTNTVSNNTIANITNNVSVTGNIFPITIGGAGSTNTINGNLIHSVSIVGTTGSSTLYGIWLGNGTSTVSNNIVRLGDNNPYEIRAIGDASAANYSKIFHNTVYLAGTPTSLALSSAALFSSGQTTSRSYKNNICYNARSNGSGATSVHYAFNANSVSGAGVIYSDGNCYYAPGTGGKIGRFSSDKTTMPVVTGHDSTSVNVDPVFANAGGTSAADYIPMAMLGVSGSTGITSDYTGVTTRVVPSIGAYEVLPTVTLSTLSITGLNGVPSNASAGWQQEFNVSGSNLAGDVVLTAPTNYEISTVGGGSFTATSPITLSRTGTSLSSTTIYVRSAGLTAGSYTENISVVAPGSTQNVSCAGVVDITVGAKTPASDELRIVNSKGQVNIIGAKAGQLIQVYNASGLLISSTIATSGDNRVSLSNGLQIIKVGSAVRKVLVK